MWSELPTVPTVVDCRTPFSFFFDLVAACWRAPETNSAPLHRLCTLARKQKARYVVFESALARVDIREEIDDLDMTREGGGAAEAISITFFRSGLSPDQIDQVDQSSIIGQAILINYRAPKSAQFTYSYIYEAIFACPVLEGDDGSRKGLLNNFICRDGEFDVSARGRVFKVRGVYYTQQNRVTSVCTQACLRMALNSIRSGAPTVTTHEINALLGITPPIPALKLQQLISVPAAISKVVAVAYNCACLPTRADYIAILSSIVESGNIALLVFTTGGKEEHVVTVYGHTRNSDEWHPQALQSYSGTKDAPYLPSSAWVDHLLIHDDNFGPYYTLSTRALEVSSIVVPHWIIGLERFFPNAPPLTAEVQAAAYLANLMPSLASVGTGRWFEYITRNRWQYILRTVTISREVYLDHLRNLEGHDQSKLTTEDIARFDGLPPNLWMVEFSLPDLFTGNRSKLGEVVMDATTKLEPESGPALIAMRLPSLIVVNEGNGLYSWPANLTSHSPIYSVRAHDHNW